MGVRISPRTPNFIKGLSYVAFNELVYVLPLEERSATTSSTTQVNNGFKGVKLHLYVEEIESVTSGYLGMHLSGVERYSNQEYYLLSSSTIVVSGVYTLTVYPGIPATSNLSANTVLPFDWKVVVAHTPSDLTAKYSVSASLYE